MAITLPDFQKFVTPYGAGTDSRYASSAAQAYAGMLGAVANASRPSDALSPQTAAEQAKGQIGAARYGAIGGVGTNYAGNYDAYSRALGQMGSNVAGQYAAYGNTLGGLGNAVAGGFGALSQTIPGMRQADAGAYRAYGDNLSNAYANYGNAMAGGYTGYGNTLSNLGGALTNNFGAFSSGLGSLSQSMANERGAMANANAMAESARQTSLGNIGSAALGAFGSAANSALAAWAQNQSSYNKALADMNLANQGAVSQFGQSRNNALGTLGSAYGATAAGSAPAAALGDVSAQFGGMDGGMGGMDFAADVGGNNLASGSFGGGGALGGLTGSVNRTSNPQGAQDIAFGAFGGIGDTRNSVMDNRVLDDLNAGAMRDGGRLDLQHMTSRNTPFTALDGILSGIRGLGTDAYGESRTGMDQFYGNAPAGTDYGSLLELLQGRADAADAGLYGMVNEADAGLRRLGSNLSSGLQDTGRGLQSGLDQYNAGAAGAYGALAGGYGGMMGALGGLADVAGSGFNNALAAQAGLAASAGGGFNTANQYTDSVFDHLQPEQQAAPADLPPADRRQQDLDRLMWSQRYPAAMPAPPRNRAQEEADRKRAAEVQRSKELMAQGWTWGGNTGGWRPPPGNPMATYTPSAAATYVPSGPPRGPARIAPGRTVF